MSVMLLSDFRTVLTMWYVLYLGHTVSNQYKSTVILISDHQYCFILLIITGFTIIRTQMTLW